MSDPTNPLGGYVWRRGGLLGLLWLAVFAGATGAAYLLLGALGWAGTGRALCAMGVGPLVGTALIVLWWAVRRPTLLPPPASDAGDGSASGAADD